VPNASIVARGKKKTNSFGKDLEEVMDNIKLYANHAKK
jgi:hypothetical protein